MRPLAFVTGGSSGIGYELAKQLAHHGYDVAISGSSDPVHDSAARLRELGVQAWSHQADASTYDGVEAVWRFIELLTPAPCDRAPARPRSRRELVSSSKPSSRSAPRAKCRHP